MAGICRMASPVPTAILSRAKDGRPVYPDCDLGWIGCGRGEVKGPN